MKFINAIFCLLSVALIPGCGKEKSFAPYEQPELKICDPQDNPGVCPATLRDDSVPSRTLRIGNEGEGLKVERASAESMQETCRITKLTLLDAYIEPSVARKGLYQGEFVSSTNYEVLSEGKDCTERDILRKCTAHISFARIACVYDVKKSTSLKN